MTKVKRNPHKARTRRNKVKARVKNMRTVAVAHRYIQDEYDRLDQADKENLELQTEEMMFEILEILPAWKCIKIFERVLKRIKKAQYRKSFGPLSPQERAAYFSKYRHTKVIHE